MFISFFANAWYGPVTITFPVATSGNPYDPAENDVRVEFVGKRGEKETRLGYSLGNGKFAATLVAKAPGSYTANVLLNGKRVATVPGSIVVSSKLAHGYIGIVGKRFAWTDGTPYFPVGFNYGWRNGQGETVADGLRKMGANGANWSRIWACHWDGKNPFFPRDRAVKIPGRELIQGPLETWDGIVAAAEKAGVDFQFVLFHHGPYSTTTNSNWGEHPWNKANGGFLADPTDFFVDSEAKRRTKIWLRYAVARYAHSPSIMAWELFNEVQWVDAVKKNPNRVGDVAAWHREMAAYVKSLDPYHHLVTSSSSESLDDHVFDAMDFLQPHTYPSNVLAAVGGVTFNQRPGFFGEFGPSAAGGDLYREQVRDGIYGGILAGHAGAGQFWFWDRIDAAGLLPDYANARKVIEQSGLLERVDAKPVALAVETPNRGDVTLAPGSGWAKSTTTSITLPLTDLKALGGWSPYFQSLDGGKKDWASPFHIRFSAKRAGKTVINIGQASSAGGTLAVWVNDKPVTDRAFPGNSRTRSAVEVEYPAGNVDIRLENHGADWVQISSIVVPDQAPTALAHGMSEPNWALIRVLGKDASQISVGGLLLTNGSYRVRVFDLLTGKVRNEVVKVASGRFRANGLPNECVLAFRR